MKKLSIEELKSEFVGRSYNWLTVLDVFRDSSRCIMFTCRCKCGNITTTRKNYVLSGHTTSCGCYNYSKEHSDKYKQWVKDNPDKIKEQAERYSQWCKDNPDKIKERSEKRLKTFQENPDIQIGLVEKQIKYWKDHPEELAERGRKRSEWSKAHPEKVREIAEKCSNFYKEHPDKRKELGKKVSEWYKTHPNEVLEFRNRLVEYYKTHKEVVENRGRLHAEYYVRHPEVLHILSIKNKTFWKNHQNLAKERGKRVSEWYKTHPEEVSKLKNNLSAFYESQRISLITDELISITHPDDIANLVSGITSSSMSIRTKCPVCGKYDTHCLNNVFRFKKRLFRFNSPPLCKHCRLSLSSSKYEDEIADYISTFYNGECIRNSRDIISPLELDLYYPEKKIAVEFNGDYWHSDKFKDKDYHYNKFKSCLDRSITLVSVFESEWGSNSKEIKNYLFNLFNGNSHSLSYTRPGYVSNNYPSPTAKYDPTSHVDEIFVFKNIKVATCGYSKLL